MDKRQKTLKEIKEVSSNGLNYITRKDYDYKKKEAEIANLESQIDDFESKGFVTEVENNMVENLLSELEQLEFNSGDILKEHIIMDNLAIQFARVNGAKIYTYGEAKSNNVKLKESKFKFEGQIKKLETSLAKEKEEKEKDAIRLDIIKTEEYVNNIIKLLNKFDEEFKDFIEVETQLVSSIKEVETKLSSLRTKHKLSSENLDKIYLKLADEKNKNDDRDGVQAEIDALKIDISELETNLPQHEIQLQELNSESDWLGQQLTLPEKDFMGVDAKLKIWDNKKNDLKIIVSEMEKRFNVKPSSTTDTKGSHPLKNILERTRVLADAIIQKDEEVKEAKIIPMYPEQDVEGVYKKKKSSFNPFVFSMLALGGYLALKK